MPKGYNIPDLRIAVGAALLGTWAKGADFANMTYANANFHRKNNGDFITEVYNVITECQRLLRRDAPEVAAEKMLEELNKRNGKMLAVIDEALAQGDVDTASKLWMDSYDRNHGKAKQSLDLNKKTTVTHELPSEVADTLKLIGETIRSSQRLYELPPVLDAEVVSVEPANS